MRHTICIGIEFDCCLLEWHVKFNLHLLRLELLLLVEFELCLRWGAMFQGFVTLQFFTVKMVPCTSRLPLPPLTSPLLYFASSLHNASKFSMSLSTALLVVVAAACPGRPCHRHNPNLTHATLPLSTPQSTPNQFAIFSSISIKLYESYSKLRNLCLSFFKGVTP